MYSFALLMHFVQGPFLLIVSGAGIYLERPLLRVDPEHNFQQVTRT